MKQFCITILFLSTCLFAIGQRDGAIGRSTMKFDRNSWNFGTIKETAGVVTHRFEFTNSGTKPFVIENVEVSCGCTKPTFSLRPVMPGKRASIDVSFDPKDRPGAFNKEIIITSNNRANRNVISITGTVEGRPRTVDDDYPVVVTAQFRITTLSVEFGYIGQNKVVSMVIGYANTSSKSVSVAIDQAMSNSYFNVVAPASVCAGCRGEITLTYDLRSDQVWGMLSDKFYLVLNGKRSTLPVSATAIATDDFTGVDQDQAARMRLSSQFFHLGDLKRNSRNVLQQVTLVNDGTKPLIIRQVSTTRDGVGCSLSSGSVVAAGQSVKFTVEVSASMFNSGRLFASVFIVVNDPMRPMREIRVVANIL